MSHAIVAYAGKPKEDVIQESIARLDRGAFNPLARAIYRALDAQEFDNGCSGCGDEKYFSLPELESALLRLPASEELALERGFLRDCIAQGEAGVTIGFW
jgi:hypothetical protein